MSEPYIFKKMGHCKNCRGETGWVLYRHINANASETFVWKCSRCEKKNPDNVPPLWISKETISQRLTPDEIEALPVIMPGLYERCARCGNRGTEKHHWAPQAMFKDADEWPQDYLCKSCHDHWHRVVTPQLTTEKQ